MGYGGHITITVKPLDPDHYKFKMKKWYKLWPYAYVHGTLARMGEETLVNASASMGWINTIGMLVMTVWIGLIVTKRMNVSMGLPFMFIFVFFSLLYHLYFRYQLCNRLVKIVGRQDKA
jgi:hypothetical protein